MISERAVGPTPDTHRGSWFLVLALVTGLAIYGWVDSRKGLPVTYQVSTPTSGKVNWFLILRMPAITAQYESGIDTMKVRYDQWLDALNQAGFHPMKLSDVYKDLHNGTGVPENTVVLAFDPGFRRTYHLVEPILVSHHWPALWLSNDQAMNRGHREYVTYHTARQMVSTGWWDVGFTQEDGTILLNTKDWGTLRLGDAQHPGWSPITGGMALNQGQSLMLLNHLNVISDWTAKDLTTRIRAELPVHRKVFLAKDSVQNMEWGVTTEDPTDPSATLHFQVLPYKRGFALDWFGTTGIANAEVHATASEVIGEFTTRLRWDEARGNGISILLSKDQLFIQELSAGHVVQNFRRERAGDRQSGQFDMTATLKNDSLMINLSDQPPVELHLKTSPTPERGLLQLFLVDKFRGSARADDVHISFTPLP